MLARSKQKLKKTPFNTTTSFLPYSYSKKLVKLFLIVYGLVGFHFVIMGLSLFGRHFDYITGSSPFYTCFICRALLIKLTRTTFSCGLRCLVTTLTLCGQFKKTYAVRFRLTPFHITQPRFFLT